MNFKNTIISLDTPRQPAKKSGTRRFVKSLEYELLANLTLQSFQKEDDVDFDLILSITPENRIPGLVEEYGNKRMHNLVVLLLKEFCHSIPLPKSKKLTETKTRVCACDLMLAAYEDFLSLEDLILFFERAKQGKYGPFKKMLTHFSLMEKLEQYRQERHAAYMKIKEQQEAQLKAMGPTERISPEPTAIRNLFDKVGDMPEPLKKIS